jgi:hypothetical protein
MAVRGRTPDDGPSLAGVNEGSAARAAAGADDSPTELERNVLADLELDNFSVGTLQRALSEQRPWLLATTDLDWPGGAIGDSVRLRYPGDGTTSRDPRYPSGEWVGTIESIRALDSAAYLTDEEVESILGFPQKNHGFRSQIWLAAERGRNIRSLLVVRFSF